MRDENPTPEQQLGELAARALDVIDGRPLEGALIMVLVDAGEDEDGDGTTEATWHVLPGQLRYTTIGMCEMLKSNLIGG